MAVLLLGVALSTAAEPPLKPAAPAQVVLKLDETSLPSSPGYHIFQATALVGGKPMPIACGISLPRSYFRPTEPMPVVVTLHNRGPSGIDGGGIEGEGLAALVIRNDPDTRGTGDPPAHPIKLHDDARFITLIPQCPPGMDWHTGPVPAILGELLTRVTRHYRCDPDRVYLTGFSYGASSTWKVALQLPQRFAAIAVLDGRATEDPKAAAVKLAGVPTYISVGDDDDDFIGEAKRMRDAFAASHHPNFIFHVVHHGNHWCYASVYNDSEFWAWMFAQHRSGSGGATRPTSRQAARRDPAAVAAPAVMRPATVPASQPFRAAVLCQYFRDLPGNQVSDLTTNAAFPRFPNEQIELGQLELPLIESDNFASVLKATLDPPLTGDYTFYIAGQDQCELWLSTDDMPNHLLQIAQVPAWSLPRDYSADPHQQSNPVRLEASRSYFIEVRHKHGVGDNHCSVAWRLPDGRLEAPIPGSRLSTVKAAFVPPARVVATKPAQWPTAPGAYLVLLSVDYLGHQQEVWVSVVLPREPDRSEKPLAKFPALIYCPEADQTGESDGPVSEFLNDGNVAAAYPLILISPQRPPGKPWDNLWLQHATAAAVARLLNDLPIDPERVYLTGNASGTTAVWSLSSLLPGRFAAIAPFNPQLPAEALRPGLFEGTKVHFITGVEDGMATDRANRLHDALAPIDPAADVAYEMHMGPETARVYYAQPSFYQWLVRWHRPAGGIAVQMLPPGNSTALSTGGRKKKAIAASVAMFAVISLTIGISVSRRRRRTNRM